MNLIQIENKIYKVPKKVYEDLKGLQELSSEFVEASGSLNKLCEDIKAGGVYGVRYLGVVEFDNR
jgi:hypothetical protein